MAVAITLQEYLEHQAFAFELIEHQPTDSPMGSARVMQIPGQRMAKPMLLGDEHAYLLTVIPANCRLELDRLNQMTARNLEIIPKDELASAFPDCDCAAIPPCGQAYGLDTLLEAQLAGQPEVFFDCGDKQHLIRMLGEDFRSLMREVPRVHCSHPIM